jgi:hypothetical protein
MEVHIIFHSTSSNTEITENHSGKYKYLRQICIPRIVTDIYILSRFYSDMWNKANSCFENGAKFRYLETTVTNQNLIQK